MVATNNLFYYLQRVQRESGLTISTSFPSSASDSEQLVLDCINSTLRELNNHYYLAFQQTTYTLTSSVGVQAYDLTQAPYSLTYWRVFRIARNGVIRIRDDYPLMYLDYTDRDWLQPDLTGNSIATHYSAYGTSLLFYPATAGEQYKVRYYSLAIGTDSTGVTQKIRLSLTDDLPMLNDEWEDALVYGATTKVRGQQKVDEKYKEYKSRWEEWRNSLEGMLQPGEDAYPQMTLASHTENYLERKIGPFFNANH